MECSIALMVFLKGVKPRIVVDIAKHSEYISLNIRSVSKKEPTMKRLLPIFCLMAFWSLTTHAQVRLQEDFETSDSTRLPTGWSKWNEAPFPIDQCHIEPVRSVDIPADFEYITSGYDALRVIFKPQS
jgi:hypothetical protein